MSKLLIATPAFGEVFYTPYVQSMFRLHRALPPSGWALGFASVAYADVAEARNFLLTHFYDKTDASHILLVDADMGFDPELVVEMLALKKPVVGVVSPKRQVNLARLAKYAAEGEAASRAIARAHDFILRPVRDRAPGRSKGFLEVEACGAGILLIERAAVTRLLIAVPEISDKAAKKTSPLAGNLDRLIRAFDPVVANGSRLSEDFSFCHRWRTLVGGEIWANISRPITHVGLHRFTGRFADSAGPRVVVAAPGATAGTKTRPANRPSVSVRSAAAPAAVRLREGAKGPKLAVRSSPPKGGNGKPAKH